MSTHRTPYVGHGEDGARRSAQIDEEEADGLDYFDDRQEALQESAQRWREQAYELMLERVGERPTLEQVRESVGSETWLAALALVELSHQVAGDLGRWTRWAEREGRYTYTGEGEERVGTFHPHASVDWDGWVADVDERGRGWSSTEHRLYQLVAALMANRPVQLPDVLNAMGSWEGQVLAVLVEWASGGNQGEHRGRYTVAPTATPGLDLLR